MAEYEAIVRDIQQGSREKLSELWEAVRPFAALFHIGKLHFATQIAARQGLPVSNHFRGGIFLGMRLS